MAAVQASEDGEHIVLTDDITLTETLTITEDVTLDLNGNDLTVTANDGYGLITRGDLTINDGVGTGKVCVEGTMTGSYSPVGIGATGNLTVNGGTFITDDELTYLIFTKGDLTINNGSFTAEYCCVSIGTGGTATVTGGDFILVNDSNNGQACLFSGNVTISGGTFNASIANAWIADGKTVTESDGTYTVG